MKSVSFTVPGKAVTKARARARTGQHGHYTPPPTVQYENLVRTLAFEAMAGRAPMTGPVRLRVLIEIEPPASWSKKRRGEAMAGEIMATKKPDLSNVVKSLEDAMNKVVYADDSQIVVMIVRKDYAEAHSVYIEVDEVDARPAP